MTHAFCRPAPRPFRSGYPAGDNAAFTANFEIKHFLREWGRNLPGVTLSICVEYFSTRVSSPPPPPTYVGGGGGTHLEGLSPVLGVPHKDPGVDHGRVAEVGLILPT